MFSADGTILFAYFQSERRHGSNTTPIPVNIVLHNAILVSFRIPMHTCMCMVQCTKTVLFCQSTNQIRPLF